MSKSNLLGSYSVMTLQKRIFIQNNMEPIRKYNKDLPSLSATFMSMLIVRCNVTALMIVKPNSTEDPSSTDNTGSVGCNSNTIEVFNKYRIHSCYFCVLWDLIYKMKHCDTIVL